MSAIVSALEGQDLKGLVVSRKELKPKQVRALQEMHEIVSGKDDYRAYRKLVAVAKTCVPIAGELGCKSSYCFPPDRFAEVHLLDVAREFRLRPPTLETDGHTTINFTRCVALTKTMSASLRLHKPPDVERMRNPGTLAYLESQLSKVPEGYSIQFIKRSEELSLTEKTTHSRRDRELHAMGF